MTDYFALLAQPRSPWLDPEQLKEAFHAKTRHAHPDAQIAGSGDEFTELNHAYQVLRDPKRRLQHLLALGGETPATRSATIPREIEQLFPEVARLTSEADAVLKKLSASTSGLSLSLLRSELLGTRAKVEQMLGRLRGLYDAAEHDLRSSAAGPNALHDLYLRFSYLSRWIAELEEKLIRLAT